MAKILLFGLETTMADDLSGVLHQLGENVQTVAPGSGAAIPGDIQLIFAPEADLVSIQRSRPGVPVIVVSRLPEVSGWLQALEQGGRRLLRRPVRTPPSAVGAELVVSSGQPHRGVAREGTSREERRQGRRRCSLKGRSTYC